MQNFKIAKYRAFIVSLILWLAIDLTSKAWAANADLKPFVFIEDFFYFTLQKNQGVAFGIEFLSQGAQIALTILILAVLIYVGFKTILPTKRNPFLNQFLLGIIIGGAMGNLIDRIRLGHVIDFIALGPIPIFNIADIGITVGLILLFLFNLRTTN